MVFTWLHRLENVENVAHLNYSFLIAFTKQTGTDVTCGHELADESKIMLQSHEKERFSVSVYICISK